MKDFEIDQIGGFRIYGENRVIPFGWLGGFDLLDTYKDFEIDWFDGRGWPISGWPSDREPGSVDVIGRS